MNADVLRELLHGSPFRPFVIHTSGGRSFRVSHPEMMLITQRQAIISLPEKESIALVPLWHIDTIEAQDPPEPASPGE